ncbi:hypothetical protein FT638_10445 [Bacillus cereus]|nr:hypothetical protein [Bacillus cereus]
MIYYSLIHPPKSSTPSQTILPVSKTKKFYLSLYFNINYLKHPFLIDVSIPDNDGVTPLQHARAHNFAEIAKILLEERKLKANFCLPPHPMLHLTRYINTLIGWEYK